MAAVLSRIDQNRRGLHRRRAGRNRWSVPRRTSCAVQHTARFVNLPRVVPMKLTSTFVLLSLGAILGTSCSRDLQALDAQQIERQYGVAGAYSATVPTADGPLKGTLVPITLADG